MKKYLIILLLLLNITGCTENDTNESKLIKNGYEKREYSTMTTYSAKKLQFTFFKEESAVLISYEDDEITATINTNKKDIINSYECELNYKSGEYDNSCTEEKVEKLKEVKTLIDNEIIKLELQLELN